jgi:Cu(I)/Ag(I) efflux system membrane fusion protein
MRLRLLGLLLLVAAGPTPGRTPLYYQDPDGKPAYAAAPGKSPDGRAFVPVFEDAPAAAIPAAGGSTPPPATPPASASGSNRILFYRNPMGLPDTSPMPKKDSMGMDYIPVRENEAAEAGAGLVTIAPGRMQVLGVRTAAVERRDALARTLRATGTVQFDERGMAVVSMRVGGWIERLEVAATGEAVRRGQVMAEIYAPDLVASEEEYLVASRMGMAAASVQRLRAMGVPDDEITRLRRTGKPAQRIPVLAPVDGVVTEKMVVQGTRVGPDQPLFRTARLSPIWVIAEVQEQDLGTVRPGQRAKTAFVAYPGRSFDGTVDFIYPSLSSDTRTGRVRIVIANADEALRAGMFASVEIASPVGEAGPVLTVPSSAVLDSGTRQVVLVERGEGRFEPWPVRLGVQGDGTTEILDGLTTGERVVVGANFLIDSESNLRAALQAFTAGQAGGKPQ